MISFLVGLVIGGVVIGAIVFVGILAAVAKGFTR